MRGAYCAMALFRYKISLNLYKKLANIACWQATHQFWTTKNSIGLPLGKFLHTPLRLSVNIFYCFCTFHIKTNNYSINKVAHVLGDNRSDHTVFQVYHQLTCRLTLKQVAVNSKNANSISSYLNFQAQFEFVGLKFFNVVGQINKTKIEPSE